QAGRKRGRARIVVPRLAWILPPQLSPPPSVDAAEKPDQQDCAGLERPAVVDGGSERHGPEFLQLSVVAFDGARESPGMPNALARAVVSLVVPPVCAGCGEPELSGHAVCPGCERRIVYLPGPRCRKCGAPVGRACDRCGECRGRSLAFDRAWSAFAYEGVPRRLVA